MNTTAAIGPISIIVIVGMAILLLFFSLFPVGLWFSAIVSGVNISIWEILVMRWRKIPVEDVVNGLIFAEKAGVKVTSDQLQAHYLAGGDIKNVVHGLVAAKQLGLELSFHKAAQADIRDIDVVEAIKNKAL